MSCLDDYYVIPNYLESPASRSLIRSLTLSASVTALDYFLFLLLSKGTSALIRIAEEEEEEEEAIDETLTVSCSSLGAVNA